MTNNKPRAYVSTYARYRSGNLQGQWVDLDQFNSVQDFIKHCCEIFIDEGNPKIMFQDWENVPDFLTGEEMSERRLERLFKFLSFGDYKRSIVVAYVDATGNSEIEFQDVFESYFGVANSEAEFAEEYVRGTYDKALSQLPDFIVIDWEGVWEQNLRHKFYVGKDDCGEKHFFYQ